MHAAGARGRRALRGEESVFLAWGRGAEPMRRALPCGRPCCVRYLVGLSLHARVLRCALALFVWVLIAVAGAELFVALESDHEIHLAQQIEAVRDHYGIGLHHSASYSYDGSAAGVASNHGDAGQGGHHAPPPHHHAANETASHHDSAEEAVELVVTGLANVSRNASCDLANDTSLGAGELLEFLSRTGYDHHRKQPPPSLNALNWTFSGALFFCFTLMTTIGYGTFAPATTHGQIAVVLFGFVGMVATGFVLGVVTRTIDGFLEELHEHCVRPRLALLTFKVLSTSGLLVTYWLLLSLYIYSTSAWTYGQSLLFLYQTISTIGLGDYTLSHASALGVVAQFLGFVPGLALFAEYLNIGVEGTKALEAKAEEELARASKDVSRTVSKLVNLSAAPAACPEPDVLAQVAVASSSARSAQAEASHL